jgi:quinoprotein glucose dehydrogenase
LISKQILWERPIGSAKDSGPLNIPVLLPLNIGVPQSGGTVVTAGGLIFIAGTFDRTVRALDLLTGKELWQHSIPYSAQGTPMTYQSPSGKQTLIVTVPVYTTNSAVGERVLPADLEDPEGGYVFAFRMPAIN